MIKEIFFKVVEDEVERFTDILMELGALSVSIECIEGAEIIKDEQTSTKEYWDLNKVGVLIQAKEYWDLNKVGALIQAEDEERFKHLEPFHTEEVAEKDWVLEVQKNTPIQVIGDTLWIVPSWHKVPKEAKEVLLLDPKNAFGTGDHPTTHLCLDWLVKNPPREKTVIDYGCGSGILMIAAKKLGAKEVFGYDIDLNAMRVARQNCEENGLLEPIDLKNEPADLVLANIHLGPLLGLVDTLFHLCKPQKTLVLSGILPFQLPELLSTYLPYFELISVDTLKSWMRVVLVKKIF